MPLPPANSLKHSDLTDRSLRPSELRRNRSESRRKMTKSLSFIILLRIPYRRIPSHGRPRDFSLIHGLGWIGKNNATYELTFSGPLQSIRSLNSLIFSCCSFIYFPILTFVWNNSSNFILLISLVFRHRYLYLNGCWLPFYLLWSFAMIRNFSRQTMVIRFHAHCSAVFQRKLYYHQSFTTDNKVSLG